MKSPAIRVLAAAALGVSVLAGCSQNNDDKTDAASSGAPGAGGGTSSCTTNRTVDNAFKLPADKPSGLKSSFKVALVRQSGVGDYFEQWGNGATKQIRAAGGEVTVYDARGNNATQVSQFDEAINTKPDVIIVDHGLADSVNPKIDLAISKGIPVVVYDVAISNCKAVYVSQDDASIANKILGFMKQDNPSGGKVAYVNVSGIAPLDSRDAVYKQFLKDNPSFTQSAKFGKYTESVAADTASEGASALTGAKDTTLAFAAYDELAKGTLIALRQNGMSKVKVYGVDISTADIQLMTQADSPWRATAATDPSNVGQIVARAAVAQAGGVQMPQKMTIPAALITQDQLREKNVTNMEELRKALPELTTPDYLGAGWIPQVQPTG